MTKILIADDEPNILMLTNVLFREMGFEVHTAANGAEAIEKAIQISPDIVITDVIMPQKDGFEVCRTLRNHPDLGQIPIIILSAMGDEYNKITGFEGGADDYITKPFGIEELKIRVKSLLARYQARQKNGSESTNGILRPATVATSDQGHSVNPDLHLEYISTGLPVLDHCLSGGFPKGSNLLVIGPLGAGKSSFARRFVKEGLVQGQRNLFVALDDSPHQIRKKLTDDLSRSVLEYEDLGLVRFVDAYSWSSFTHVDNEPFAINGILELNQLSGVISDAGYELGQTIQNKLGGRRVIDSISSLLINFELPSVQRFINQIGRTSLAFGGVTTLFIMEEGTVSETVLNNIKYIMDGVIELDEIDGQRQIRVASMKWIKADNRWNPIQ